MRAPAPLLALALALALASPVAAQDAPAGPQPAPGSPQLVDRIIAVVDEEPILLSDLEREIESYRFEQQASGQDDGLGPAEVRQAMLDRLVEVKLLVAQARLDGVEVRDEDVEREVEANLEQLVQRFGGMPALQRELARSGMTLDDLRERNRELVRNRIYTARMVNLHVRPGVEVREEEVRAYFDANRDELPPRPGEVELASILVVPQPSDAERARITAALAAIDSSLAAGTSFADVARAFSEGPNAARGGELGSFARGDLFNPVLEELAWQLPVGRISEPVYTELGVHRLLVSDRDDEQVTLSQVFLRMDVGEGGRESARERADEVVRRARAGQDFAELAREWSDDPGSRDQGGRLGRFPVDELSQQFRAAIDGLPEGGVSDPVGGSAGFFVLKVLDRAGGGAWSYEEVADRLRRVVEEQKVQEALEEYLGELRDRFYIEIKA